MFKKLLILSILLIILNQNTNANSEQIEIVLQFPDTTVSTGVTDGYLSVYLDNFVDEIFGFQFVLVSARPDLFKFNFDGDGYDVAGTLLEDFEYIDAIDVAGDQSRYWFRCIADLPQIIGNVSGIVPPQQGGVALRIPFTTTNAPDTTLPYYCDLQIWYPTDFSDPFGNSIGAIPDTLVDTIYYACTEWIVDSCANWIEVTENDDYDAYLIDSTVIGRLDSTIIQVIDGSVFIEIKNCDLDGSGFWEISDLICLVDFMFYSETSEPCPIIKCETDVDNFITIGDLVYLVNFMFGGGPPPPDLP